MSYTAAHIAEVAARLVHDLPGLHYAVARAWVSAEQGANDNPLGTTHTGPNGQAVLDTFSSWQAGIDYAADSIKTSHHYGGIRATLKGGSVRDQALAIIASPWNTPGSPYYTRVFTKAGLLGGSAGGPAQPVPGKEDPLIYVYGSLQTGQVSAGTGIRERPDGPFVSKLAATTRFLILGYDKTGRFAEIDGAWLGPRGAHLVAALWVSANALGDLQPAIGA